MSINFEINILLLTSGQYIEIVHSSKIVAGGRQNIKLADNTSWIDIRLIFNDDEIGIKLHGKAIIMANRRLFKIIAAMNNYVETFTFRKDSFLV